MTEEKVKLAETIRKIKEIVRNQKYLLPKYATADITLRFETSEEVKEIGEALKLTVHEPTNLINHTWCLYKTDNVQVYIQTHEIKKSIKN